MCSCLPARNLIFFPRFKNRYQNCKNYWKLNRAQKRRRSIKEQYNDRRKMKNVFNENHTCMHITFGIMMSGMRIRTAIQYAFKRICFCILEEWNEMMVSIWWNVKKKIFFDWKINLGNQQNCWGLKFWKCVCVGAFAWHARFF